MKYFTKTKYPIILGLSLALFACDGQTGGDSSDPSLTLGDDGESAGDDSGISCSDEWCGDDAVALVAAGTESSCALDSLGQMHYALYQDINDTSDTGSISEIAVNLAEGLTTTGVDTSRFSLLDSAGNTISAAAFDLGGDADDFDTDGGLVNFLVSVEGLPATEDSYTIAIGAGAVTCLDGTTNSTDYTVDIEIYKIYRYECDGMVCQLVE